MDEKFDYDFSGWATRYNVRCSDGRDTAMAYIYPISFRHFQRFLTI